MSTSSATSSPRRKGSFVSPKNSSSSSFASPKNSHSASTFDDGNSVYGNSSVYSSVIGHDDPTAVMGNIARSDCSYAVKSIGTIDSFVTTEHERDHESREPLEATREPIQIPNVDEDEDLREQLDELDRAEEEWKAKRSASPKSLVVNTGSDVEDFYLHEVGGSGPSPARHRLKVKTQPETIDECDDVDVDVDEENQEEALDTSKPSSPALEMLRSKESNDDSRASGYVSSDQSMTSAEYQSFKSYTETNSLLPMSSDEEETEHQTIREMHISSDPSGEEKVDTNEIVRQVQRRLICSQDNIIGPPVNRPPTTPNPEQSNGKFHDYIPVVDEAQAVVHGRGLAAHTDMSDDEESIGEGRYARIRRRRILFPFIILLLLVGLILALVFTVGDRDGSNNRNDGIIGDPSGFSTPAPTSSATDEPLPTAGPVSPSVAPVADGTFSPSAAPVVLSSARDRLLDISGDALDDPNSPQSEAYEWLLDSDPADLDLDTLPHKVLEQRYIAALLYFSTNGNDWEKDYGFMSAENVCQWQDDVTGKGIMCNDQGTIEEFTINENNLAGLLPFEMEQLSGLKKVEFRGNSLGGSIPTEFGRLSMLEEFDLRQNELEGSFPASVLELPELRKLFMLRNRNLGGTIPVTLGRATNLEMMSFQRCKLTGSLPTTIGLLSKLYFLTLLDNELTGSIPEELGQLPFLEVLELSENNISGTIPRFIGQPALYFISFFENELSGSIPDSFGELSGLLFFDARDNALTGTIPETFSTIPELVTFYVADNQLTGPIPSFSGNQGLLQAVDMARNRLTGGIEDFWSADRATTERLHSVNLAFNMLTGIIPSTIGQFTALSDVVLDFNELTGPIPIELGNLILLDTLLVKGNQLSGTIPEEMGQMEKIQFLDLGGNQLSGTITDTLSLLSELSQLDLSNNQLSGAVPQAWTSLRELDELYLQSNNLTGDFDAVLCPDSERLTGKFVADCAPPQPEVTCTCCTSCCNDETDRCSLN